MSAKGGLSRVRPGTLLQATNHKASKEPLLNTSIRVDAPRELPHSYFISIEALFHQPAIIHQAPIALTIIPALVQPCATENCQSTSVSAISHWPADEMSQKSIDPRRRSSRLHDMRVLSSGTAAAWFQWSLYSKFASLVPPAKSPQSSFPILTCSARVSVGQRCSTATSSFLDSTVNGISVVSTPTHPHPDLAARKQYVIEIQEDRSIPPQIASVTLIRCGGHFPGSKALDWDRDAESQLCPDAKGVAVFCADTLMVMPDGKRLSFAYSFPNNNIPLALSPCRENLDADASISMVSHFPRLVGSSDPLRLSI
ncbi:hypothetical protein NDA11_007282 [Ustilago hordei]|nr:hypothetical protein NDA10_006013 [Ustilago hordei]KAJ1571052.1 hypothetical protein NDA11_007282 [Ustilago hordei]KAJ1589873.1 hypothetical protein NDA12_001784 [Ustilago hordei]KAJ1602092.1 hypothetical protein NDA14_001543 [Ustilago hordei]UTT97034.1 hypothetical protein NDA17_002950 [Ustilago hordei]